MSPPPPQEHLLSKHVCAAVGCQGVIIVSVDEYLQVMLEPFWVAVFGTTPTRAGCGGFVEAHADKAVQYLDSWSEAGVPFKHGVLLYMLTFTAELGETPKYQSMEWVIQNYPRYLHVILDTELIVFLKHKMQ